MGVRYDGLVTPHKPGGAIDKYRLVKHGSSDGEVVQAAGADAAIIGVSTRIAVAATDPQVDVVRGGVAEVEYGAAISRGDRVTSDADGKAISSAPGVGAHAFIAGFAEVSGNNGDIGSVFLSPGYITG